MRNEKITKGIRTNTMFNPLQMNHFDYSFQKYKWKGPQFFQEFRKRLIIRMTR